MRRILANVARVAATSTNAMIVGGFSMSKAQTDTTMTDAELIAWANDTSPVPPTTPDLIRDIAHRLGVANQRIEGLERERDELDTRSRALSRELEGCRTVNDELYKEAEGVRRELSAERYERGRAERREQGATLDNVLLKQRCAAAEAKVAVVEKEIRFWSDGEWPSPRYANAIKQALKAQSPEPASALAAEPKPETAKCDSVGHRIYYNMDKHAWWCRVCDIEAIANPAEPAPQPSQDLREVLISTAYNFRAENATAVQLADAIIALIEDRKE
jgi:hypothetical protein